ncbi:MULTISPECIES: hemerythrin domain-containing protein [Mycobacteriaceae]|uniref:Hemerythrin domain-containing protein n=1 Tax=Mycolicibacterium mucogenicum DSM 44124 TaxID=1226753 RepID=A0A8E4W0G8_MYCMU|nr:MULTISPECIES: hemerythrin domain-containing protein [Mycobacteriaceae]QPG67088.1 hemerythrin domain-containing protein [Mycolicibacterium mucogenicum DSM 44124]
MRTVSTTATDDVIDYVKARHLMARELFRKTLHAADAAARRQRFAELRAALTAQEVSGELLVHPRVRRGLVVESLRGETDDTKERLDRMARLDPASAEFETALTDLQQATEDHTQRVEAEEFPLLTDRR